MFFLLLFLMRTSIVVLLSFLIYAFNAAAQNTATDIFKTELKSIDGSAYSFNNLKLNKATVIIFLSPDCPMCQNYTLTIKELNDKYSKSNISFIAVFPGTWYSVKDVIDFKDEYKLNISMLMDTSKVIS